MCLAQAIAMRQIPRMADCVLAFLWLMIIRAPCCVMVTELSLYGSSNVWLCQWILLTGAGSIMSSCSLVRNTAGLSRMSRYAIRDW